jgi:hypothetical protein
MKLLLEAVSTGEQAREVARHANEVLRTKFAEQACTQASLAALRRARSSSMTVSGEPENGGL